MLLLLLLLLLLTHITCAFFFFFCGLRIVWESVAGRVIFVSCMCPVISAWA